MGTDGRGGCSGVVITTAALEGRVGGAIRMRCLVLLVGGHASLPSAYWRDLNFVTSSGTAVAAVCSIK